MGLLARILRRVKGPHGGPSFLLLWRLGGMVMRDWRPSSWQEKPATQQPAYPDAEAVARVVEQLSSLPPLVTSWEVEGLKTLLARAARGDHFLLQGGDCAESFDECDPSAIAAKLKILLQMSLVLIYGGRKGVVRVGRLAGQYAKPRSADTESRGDVTLPAYRGDLVNRSAFTREARTPDPELLLRGYERAALTLNFTRALAEGGFADLHHPEYWDLSFVKDRSLADEYQRIVNSLRESLEFMEAVSGNRFSEARRVDFYTSHEGLALLYEQAQTRTVPRREGWYNLSCHMPWIGMRTAQLEGAHVEYFRGIRNPIGIKTGPAMSPEWLTELCARARSRRRAGPPGADPPHGRGRDRREAAAAHRGGAAHRPHGAVVLGSDARQHRDDEQRLQDAPLRQHPVGARAGVRHPRSHGDDPRRRALRDDRRQRHRVHRRRQRRGRG